MKTSYAQTIKKWENIVKAIEKDRSIERFLDEDCHYCSEFMRKKGTTLETRCLKCPLYNKTIEDRKICSLFQKSNYMTIFLYDYDEGGKQEALRAAKTMLKYVKQFAKKY